MQTLILDFDGTIADTGKVILATVAHTLQRLGCPKVEEEEVRKLIGLPLRDMFSKAARITDEALLQKCIEVYRADFNDFCGEHLRLYPEVRETLEALKLRGTTLAIASSRGRASLLELLERLEIAHLFGAVVGEEDVEHTKPAPDAVHRILDATGTAPQEALVVGDTVFDIAMGRAAGTATCGVTYGNHPAERLLTAGPTHLIPRFGELLKIMEAGA